MGKNLKGKELGIGMSQRPNGLYEYRFSVKGKRYTVYGKTVKETIKKADEKKAEIIKEAIIPTNITLGEWFDKWFTEQKSPQLKNDQSRSTYKRKSFNTFVRLLGSIPIAELTQMQIQNAANILRIDEGYKKRTVCEGLGSIRECLDVALVNHLIKFNPCVSIAIKDDEFAMVERSVFTKKQQKMLLEEIHGNYYEPFYKILLLTGMRIGEFSGLQWEDIDWMNKRIRVERSLSTGYVDHKRIMELTAPKTYNSVRYIPFFGETEKILKEWKTVQDERKKKLGSHWRNKDFGNLVFTSSMGSPATRYVMQSDMRTVERNLREKYGEDAPHIHPHAFRHTFATRCFEKGMSPLVVQKIMGHKNYSMTVSYTHANEEVMEEAARQGNFL